MHNSTKFMVIVTSLLSVLPGLNASARTIHRTQSHAQFVQTVLKNANDVNNDILKNRTKLLKLDQQYQQSHSLSYWQRNWLNDLASNYKTSASNLNNHNTWVELEKRVDAIPPSLVLAQSIQESGWGSSYLARDANNYFGQECGSSSTCYRSTDYRHFNNVHEAIKDYIHNLNSNRAYAGLRNTRYDERIKHQTPNSLQMANGLGHYSVLKGQYISSVQKLIRNYDLQQYDTKLA